MAKKTAPQPETITWMGKTLTNRRNDVYWRWWGWRSRSKLFELEVSHYPDEPRPWAAQIEVRRRAGERCEDRAIGEGYGRTPRAAQKAAVRFLNGTVLLAIARAK